MPYRIRKPYIIVNGQRLVSPTEVPQKLPFCDQCDTLAPTLPRFTLSLPLTNGGDGFHFQSSPAKRKHSWAV